MDLIQIVFEVLKVNSFRYWAMRWALKARLLCFCMSLANILSLESGDRKESGMK